MRSVSSGGGQWHRALNKVAGAGSSNFPTDSCRFPTKGIMGGQNFNAAPRFSQNGFFIVNFALLD